ncbi:Ankyrin repeat domain-containing protein 17 [Hondaea fermentalgiana]|uniref:Ankyrin repeat domain-containing protein 17 n=1 Tax=Hondaea fermentalgiana TaxID=2315210 RepID=A0A2R5GL37_9STRA|nr:Ankyrin repeat domain-containing protein 17 [Hondaea fermentalgiana]|eukprot:GBG31019.1 Ankyrin repeat domain-containing protein 17 [Hondaea fermentalgiana]
MAQNVRVFVDVPVRYRRKLEGEGTSAATSLVSSTRTDESSTALVLASPSSSAVPVSSSAPQEQEVAKQVRDYVAAHRAQVNFIAEIPHKNGKALWTTFIFSCKSAFAETLLNQLGEFGVGAKSKGIGIITVCPIQIERIGSLPVKVGYVDDATLAGAATTATSTFVVSGAGLASSPSASPLQACSDDSEPHAALMRVESLAQCHGTAQEDLSPLKEQPEHDEHVVTEEHDVTEAPKAPADPLTLESYTAGFRETIRARIAVDNVVELINGAAEFTFDFLMLVFVASVLAAMGLLSNNAVVIVASMLVSPLMGPILAVTFGLTVLDRDMIKRGLVGEMVGLCLSVVTGFFCGLLAIPLMDANKLPTDQMWSRCTPDALVLGVAIAIPSGVGVALSVLGNNTSSLVGVAISASLLPPAVNTGIVLAMLVLDVLGQNGGQVTIDGDDITLTSSDLSRGALYSLLLTLSNILCIWVSGVIMFRIKEITPVGQRSNFWKEYVPKARQFNVTLTRSGSEAVRLRSAMRNFLERQQQAYQAPGKKIPLAMATPTTTPTTATATATAASGAGAKVTVIPYAEGKLKLSTAEFQFFSQLFTILDSDGDGAIAGKEGAAFLRRAKLSDKVLGEIWRLACGGTSKAKLDLHEWFLACKFVSLVQHGHSTAAQSETEPELSREFLFQNKLNLGLPEFGIFPSAPDYTTDVSPALSPSTCQVRVTDPVVAGTGMKKHVIYTISLRSTLPHFQRQHTIVTRRYSDFRWLHGRLRECYPGTVVPPLPETRMFGNMSAAFVEARRLALEQYLDEVTRHPKFTQSFAVQAMLDATSQGFDVYRLMMDAARRPLLHSGTSAAALPSAGTLAAANVVAAPMGGLSHTGQGGAFHGSSAHADTDFAWEEDLDIADIPSAGMGSGHDAAGVAQGASSGAGELPSAAAARAADVAGAAAAAASSWISSLVKKVEQSSIVTGIEEATGAASPGTAPQMEDAHIRRELTRLGIRTDVIESFRAELAEYGKRLRAAVKVVDKLVGTRRAGGYELARIGAYFGSLAQVEASCADLPGAAPTPDQALFQDLAARFDQSSNHVQDLNDRAALGLLAPLRYQAGKIGAMSAIIDNHDARVQALRYAREASRSATKRYQSARARSPGVADAALAAKSTAERDISDAEHALVQLHQSVTLEMQKFTAERALNVNRILQAFATTEIQGAAEMQQMLVPLQQLCSDNFHGPTIDESLDRIHPPTRPIPQSVRGSDLRERQDAIRLLADTEKKLETLLHDFRERSKPFARRKKTTAVSGDLPDLRGANMSLPTSHILALIRKQSGDGLSEEDLKQSHELLYAGKAHDLNKCKRILERKDVTLDTNQHDEDENTCLMHLLFPLTEDTDRPTFQYSQNDWDLLLEVISLLVKHGANVNKINRIGQSALWVACNENEIEIIKSMIDAIRPIQELPDNVRSQEVHRFVQEMILRYPNPNQFYEINSTSNHTHDGTGSLWHLAFVKDSVEILHELLEAQVKLQVQWQYFVDCTETKLSRAAEKLDKNMILTLTKWHAPRNLSWSSHPVHAAIVNAQNEPDRSFDGSPVHAALRLAQNEAEAKRYIEAMLDEQPMDEEKKDFLTLFDPNAVDADGYTTLHLACRRGFDNCISTLLTYRLFYGRQSEKTSYQSVNLNLKGGPKDYTALMWAVKNGHTATVRELFEQNNLGDLQHDLALRETSMRQTALHLACAQPKELDEVVAILCKSKAAVNLKDNEGFSPLHLAAMHGHVMIVKCLLNYNANAAARTKTGKETTLHIAAAYGHINITSILIRKGGAEVGAENKDGRTALHYAFTRHSYLHRVVEQIIAANEEKLRSDPDTSETVQLFLDVIKRRNDVSRPKKLRLHARAGRNASKISPESRNEPLFTFDRHRDSPQHRLYRDSGARSLAQSERLEDLENLFLEINNQNMLIKLLLEAGGDLDHEDNEGDPAFMTNARFDWFDLHEDEMTDIFDRPNEIGYDSEIFMDKRTQFAVRTVWIATGMRTKTVQSLCSWMIFLGLLTMLAIQYSGRNSYEAFSMQAGIIDRVAADEWDEVDLKGLAEVGNLDDWRLYLNNVVLEALWESDQAYVDDQGIARNVGSNGALLNGQLGLLGRPRYRQLRTRPSSCSSSTPSIIAQTDETCFQPYTRGTYRPASSEVEDRIPFTCALSNGTDLLLTWEENPAFPVFGSFGFYGPGGFSVTLPRNRTEAEALLHDLNECNFVSLNTRFAVIEFTLYSRSEGLFTHGRVFLEMTAAGGIFSGQRWETRKLVSYTSDRDMRNIWIEVALVIYLIRYFTFEIRSMFDRWGANHKDHAPKFWRPLLMDTDKAIAFFLENQKTFRVFASLPDSVGMSICLRQTRRIIPPYWINPFNYVDICIMIIFLALTSVHAHVASQVLARLDMWHTDSAQDTFIDISDVLWYANVRQHLLAFAVFLCYIKSLEFLQVSASMAIPVIIIGGMLTQLLSFFLIFAVFILAFGLFDFVLYGLTYEPASSVLRALVATFRASLGDLDFDGKYELDRTLGIFMTVLSASLLVILLLNLLIAIMNEAYEETKDSAEARWCYMQFRMIVEYQRKLSSKKVLQKGLQGLEKRFEGIEGLRKGIQDATTAHHGPHPPRPPASGAASPSARKGVPPPARPAPHLHRHDEDGVAHHGSFSMRSPEAAHSVYLRAAHLEGQTEAPRSPAPPPHPALTELSAYLQQRALDAASSTPSRKATRKVVPHP